jgi:hypothetical protein
MSVALLSTFQGLIRREKIKNEFINGSEAQQCRIVDNPVTRSFSEFRVEFNPHEIPLMVQRDQSGCAISGEWIEYRVAFWSWCLHNPERTPAPRTMFLGCLESQFESETGIGVVHCREERPYSDWATGSDRRIRNTVP